LWNLGLGSSSWVAILILNMEARTADIPGLAVLYVSEDRLDEVPNALRQLTPTQAAYLLVHLMKNCTAAQASQVTYLLSEFVDPKWRPEILWLLRRTEYRMYHRLDMCTLSRRCLIRYLSLSAEGIAFVKSLNIKD